MTKAEKKIEEQALALPMKWQIKGVELVSLSLVAAQTTQPIQVFSFNIGVEFRAAPAEKLVFVIVPVKIYNNDAPTIEVGTITVSCIYLIENFEEFVNIDGGIVRLPKNYYETLISVSVSTTRGVMASSFKGTILNGATLPIVDPRGFIQPE